MDKYANFPTRKDGSYAEHYQAVDYIWKGVLISFAVSLLLSLFAYPLGYLASYGFSDAAWVKVKAFYVYLKSHPFYLVKSYFGWMITFTKAPFQSWSVWIPALPFFTFIAGVLVTIHTNPYYFASQSMGSGRLADENDVKKMGLWNGFTYVLGLWNDRRLLRLNNYMSVLVVGAPETGKTAGVVVPSILENDDKCMFINDMKGELFELTGGHRAELGPVFNVNFFGIDKPDQGVFWPTWNPLSDRDLPPPSPGRQGYIGGLAFFLLGGGPASPGSRPQPPVFFLFRGGCSDLHASLTARQ